MTRQATRYATSRGLVDGKTKAIYLGSSGCPTRLLHE